MKLIKIIKPFPEDELTDIPRVGLIGEESTNQTDILSCPLGKTPVIFNSELLGRNVSIRQEEYTTLFIPNGCIKQIQ